VIYLDSCALVKLVVAEEETPDLERFLDGRRAEMVSCQLALTEVVRVVRRSGCNSQRELIISSEALAARMEAAANLLDRIDLVVVNRGIFIEAAAFAEEAHVGSLDAIHLACARKIGSELTDFVTYDGQLAGAAEAIGLPVTKPGAVESRRASGLAGRRSGLHRPKPNQAPDEPQEPWRPDDFRGGVHFCQRPPVPCGDPVRCMHGRYLAQLASRRPYPGQEESLVLPDDRADVLHGQRPLVHLLA
jgi:uncharacterized protein